MAGGATSTTTLRAIPSEFIERLWRSLNYECVYLHVWETGSQAKAGTAQWMTFYNRQRSHTAHRDQNSRAAYGTPFNPTSRTGK